MTHLHFAQLSDIHISAHGDLHDMLSGQAAGFLEDVVNTLNRQSELDFVLITGDVMVEASPTEFDRFRQAIQKLQKPWFIIPGNHDRRDPGSPNGLTRQAFAGHYNPQAQARLADNPAQPGYWSLPAGPEIQLIGLDSIVDDDWGGVINGPQLAWLKQELDSHADKLVIVAVHHPLHPLAPIDGYPGWERFVCRNGPAVLALLDTCPQVKLVLTGHHHLTRADWLGGRLHLACPALCIYPCGYRTVQVSRQGRGPWQVAWQTHPAAPDTIVAGARQLMVEKWGQGRGLDRDFVEAYAGLAMGRVVDRAGQAEL
jgi:3',5'-cyclic AMP phosphodiesterase CpdA